MFFVFIINNCVSTEAAYCDKMFSFDNFKSFEKTELNIENITTLIGTNSSGKSNAIEGIAILAMSSTGIDLSTFHCNRGNIMI